jgi:hypothetical protein
MKLGCKSVEKYPMQRIYPEFVDKNLLCIDWDYVSEHRALTETDMRRYARFLNWEVVCRTQKIKKQLAREFIALINVDLLQEFQPHLSVAEIVQLRICKSQV